MNTQCGIYLLTNRVNGKIYVGKAGHFHKRFLSHKQAIRTSKKTPIVNAIRKYGWDNFDIQILESFDPKTISSQGLLELETGWIRKLDAINKGYNLLEVHMDWTGHKHSIESKRKMSGPRPSIMGPKHPMFGKHHGEATKEKMSQKKKNIYLGNKNPFWGRKHSEETKRKIREANKKRDFSYRNKPVQQIHPVTNALIKTWPSAKLAGIALGFKNSSSIGSVCKGKARTAFGFRWSYV